MAAMKSMPHLKPMLYANNKVLVKNFNDCYEQVLAELGKTQESRQSSQEGMYTKKDYDNMILKKERLILKKNAELFPEGKCKIALELFDKYESIKAAKREPTVSFRKDIPIKPKQFAKAEKQQCSVKKGNQIVKQKQNLGYLSDKNLFRHKGTNKVANIETLMESVSSLYANFQDQDIEDGEGSIFDEKAQDLEAQPIKDMGKQGRAKDSSKLKKAASKQKKIKCMLTNSVLLKSNVNKEQCGQKISGENNDIATVSDLLLSSPRDASFEIGPNLKGEVENQDLVLPVSSEPVTTREMNFLSKNTICYEPPEEKLKGKNPLK